MSGVLVDVAVAGFLGYALWRGSKRGLVRAITKILGLLVATVAAALLHSPVASMLEGLGVSDSYDDLFAAGLVFIGVVIGFRLAGDTIAKALRFTKIGGLADAGLGAAISGIWALSLATIILLGISLFEDSAAAKAVEESELASGIVDGAPGLVDAVSRADLRQWLLEILRPEEAGKEGTGTES